MSRAPSWHWDEFHRRLERAKAPSFAWPRLTPALGPQVYVARREAVIVDAAPQRLFVEVSNVGADAELVQATILDAAGQLVGAPLPADPFELGPGQQAIPCLEPSAKQWDALRAGGGVVFGAGSLPSLHRTLRVRSGPYITPSPQWWRFPAPYHEMFEVEVGAGAPEWEWVEVAGDGEGTPAPRVRLPLVKDGRTRRNGLFLAPQPYLYRFGSDAAQHGASALAAWSRREMDGLTRTMIVRNPAGVAAEGRLKVSRPGMLTTDPDRVSIGAASEAALHVSLGPASHKAAERLESSRVELFLESQAGKVRSVPLVTVFLAPESPEGAALRLDPAQVPGLSVSSESGRTGIWLPLSNPGRRAAEVWLELSTDGEAGSTGSAVVPPDLAGRPFVRHFFELGPLPRSLPRQRLSCVARSHQALVWDPRLLDGQLSVALADFSLSWESEKPAAGIERARLRLTNGGCVEGKLQQLNISADGTPRDSKFPGVLLPPGATAIVHSEQTAAVDRSGKILRLVRSLEAHALIATSAGPQVVTARSPDR